MANGLLNLKQQIKEAQKELLTLVATQNQLNDSIAAENKLLEETKVKLAAATDPTEVDQLNKQIALSKASLNTLNKRLDITENKVSTSVQNVGRLRDSFNDVNEQVAIFTSGSKFEQVGAHLGDIGGKLLSMDFEGAAESAARLRDFTKSITFTDAAKGLKDLGSTFLSLSKALLTNPLFLMAAVAYAIYEILDQLGIMKLIFDQIKKSVGPIVDFINSMVEKLKELMGFITPIDKEFNKQKKSLENIQKLQEKKVTNAQFELDLIKAQGGSLEDQQKAQKKLLIEQEKEVSNKLKLLGLEYQYTKLLYARGLVDKEQVKEARIAAEEGRKEYNEFQRDKKIAYAEMKTAEKEEDKKASDERQAQFEKAEEKRKAAAEEKRKTEEEAHNAILKNIQDEKEAAIKRNQAEVDAINKAKADRKKEEKDNADYIYKTYQDNAKLITDLRQQAELDNKKTLQERTDYEYEILKNKLAKEQRIKLEQTKGDAELIAQVEEEYRLKKAAAEKEYNQKSVENERATQVKRLNITSKYLGMTQDLFNGIADLITANSKANAKKQFNIKKGLDIVNAGLSSAQAVLTYLASNPLTIAGVPNPGAIAGLAVLSATSALNIAKIASAKYEPNENSAGSSGGISGAGSVPNISMFGNSNNANDVNAKGTMNTGNTNTTNKIEVNVGVDEITKVQNKVNYIEGFGKL